MEENTGRRMGNDADAGMVTSLALAAEGGEERGTGEGSSTFSSMASDDALMGCSGLDSSIA